MQSCVKTTQARPHGFGYGTRRLHNDVRDTFYLTVTSCSAVLPLVLILFYLCPLSTSELAALCAAYGVQFMIK